MTSVTKRNMLDPTGKVGDCSYTPHNHHPLGWIFLQGKNMSFFYFFYFLRKQCLHKVLNLHQLPNEAYRCYNCVPNILPTPCTSLTYVAEKVLLRQGKDGQNKPENHQNWDLAKIAPKSDKGLPPYRKAKKIQVSIILSGCNLGHLIAYLCRLYHPAYTQIRQC